MSDGMKPDSPIDSLVPLTQRSLEMIQEILDQKNFHLATLDTTLEQLRIALEALERIAFFCAGEKYVEPKVIYEWTMKKIREIADVNRKKPDDPA